MSKGVSEALLKGRRGIAIDWEKSNVGDIIRNEAGLQKISITEIAVLSGIKKGRLDAMLAGEIGISEVELRNVEDVLGIKIDRSKLTPIKWRLC